MALFVLVDWNNEEVLAVFNDKESAEAHVENECSEDDHVTIEEVPYTGENDE